MGPSAITIRRLVAEDAPALVQCFERCYGRSYVVAEFYDPAATAERIASGVLRSVIAVDETGEIVGHMGITIRDARARTVDAGNSIVDPRHRGQQIAVRLAEGVIALCREGRFLGFHHYPTTAHPIMQTLAVAGGGIETGIMLDYIPPGTEYREIEGGRRHERLAVVVVYQPLAPTPTRNVYAPESLREPIREIHARGRLPRRLASDAASELPSCATHLESTFHLRRGLLRIDVETIGGDLRDRVESEIDRAGAAVWQVDLRMGDPALDAAARELRGSGFFFSAVLPEYLEGDVLRLQRIAATEMPSPDLVTEDARSMLRSIAADRAAYRPEP